MTDFVEYSFDSGLDYLIEHPDAESTSNIFSPEDNLKEIIYELNFNKRSCNEISDFINSIDQYQNSTPKTFDVSKNEKSGMFSEFYKIYLSQDHMECYDLFDIIKDYSNFQIKEKHHETHYHDSHKNAS